MMSVLVVAASPGPPFAENDGNCAECRNRVLPCVSTRRSWQMRSKEVTRTPPHAAGGRSLARLVGYVHAPAGLGLDQALGAELADGALDRAV